MKKVLTSTTGIIVAVLLVLVAVGIWTLVGTDKRDPQAELRDADQIEESTAVGGGPIEPSETESARPADEPTGAELNPGDLLDEPTSARSDNSVQFADDEQPSVNGQTVRQSDVQQPFSEPPDLPLGAEEDQEAAYRADRAPEADVIAVVPAGSPTPADDEGQPSEGGGPIDETGSEEMEPDEAATDQTQTERSQTEAAQPEGVTDREFEGDDQADTERAQPQQVEDLMEQLEREESEANQINPDRRSPIPPPGESPTADDPIIERPTLQGAPRPSRPGEE